MMKATLMVTGLFSGEVNWVRIDLEKDDHAYLITSEERFHLAMVRQ